MFNRHSSQCEVQGQKITVETGYMARQANGAVYVSTGENRVLVTAVSSQKDSDLDFFPLTVEYQEKFYSVGRVPGGFFKREGRPSNEATLCARLIDRSIRPCFSENYRRDTQVAASVLSSDGLFPVEILAGIGASTALHISDIPLKGPVSFVQVAFIKENFVLNPGMEALVDAKMNLIVAGTPKGLLMVEGEASFVSEAQVLKALKQAHLAMDSIFKMQEDLREKTGNKAKQVVKVSEVDESVTKKAKDFLEPEIKKALKISEKTKRSQALTDLKASVLQECAPSETESSKDDRNWEKSALEVFEELHYSKARELTVNGEVRIDGRKTDEVRPIFCEIGLLPRVHGSAVFTRGETQVLGTVTLGTGDDEKMIDSLQNFYKKQFFLHYNFPPYCVGETGRFGGQSRREIGHGFLAERALRPVIPSHETFPYTIRVVSEVLESNGSSSMGTVCSGMMALLDAGVPARQNIAGIAMGLIKEGDKVVILSDILGDEDHLGDMDFKVAGSREGITALQMDIKIDSIGFDIIEKALKQAFDGRLHILDEMEKAISSPSKELSDYAPRIEVLKIKPEKIREVIGPGGKVINGITEETGVKINIEDDGTLFLSSTSKDQIARAKEIIDGICEEVEEGKIYEGRVTGIKEFGAFVEILPKTSGLLHISQISNKRIDQVTDVLSEGDMVKVKVLSVESNGRIRLSAKAVNSPNGSYEKKF